MGARSALASGRAAAGRSALRMEDFGFLKGTGIGFEDLWAGDPTISEAKLEQHLATLQNELRGEDTLPPNYCGSCYGAAMDPSLCCNTCDDLLRSNAAGFVCVTGVDMEREKVTLLAPSPLALPTAWLLAGTLKWAHQDV